MRRAKCWRRLGPDARPLAGGQTLIPMMKLRLLKPSDLIDLRGIAGADDIRETGDAIEIGALARHEDIGRSEIAARYPILKDCALGIADVQVRNMGTIGGSLAEADPNSCWPALLVALDAQVRCVSQNGQREQSVRELAGRCLYAQSWIGRTDHPHSDRPCGAFGLWQLRRLQARSSRLSDRELCADGAIRRRQGAFRAHGLWLPRSHAARIGRERARSPASRSRRRWCRPWPTSRRRSSSRFADNKGGESYKRSLLKGLVKRAFDNVERRRKGEAATETHFYYG